MLAIFLPTIAVLFRSGCGLDLLVNIALLFLGYFPAILHAWYVILWHKERKTIARRRSSRDSMRSGSYAAPRRSTSRSRSRSSTRRSCDSYEDTHPRSAKKQERYAKNRYAWLWDALSVPSDYINYNLDPFNYQYNYPNNTPWYSWRW